MHVYYVSLTRESRSLYRPSVLSVLAVVLVHKPTAKICRQLLNKHSCSFTHLVAHALHLGAIEVSLRLRAAHLEVVLSLRLRLRDDGARSPRRVARVRRGGAVVRRLDIPRVYRRDVHRVYRRLRGSSRDFERGGRGRRDERRLVTRFRRRGGAGSCRKRRAESRRERRRRGLEPAIDVRGCRGERGGRDAAGHRSRRRRGGGRPRGGGRVEQSRGLPSESERQAR